MCPFSIELLMPKGSENPYSPPLTHSQSSSRRLPLREIVFACALSFMTLGAVMYNHDLPVQLHNPAIFSLGLEAALFSLWGCLLAARLFKRRGSKRRCVAYGVVAAISSTVGAGIAISQIGVAPHGLLLPIGVSIGITTTYLGLTRSCRPTIQ